MKRKVDQANRALEHGSQQHGEHDMHAAQRAQRVAQPASLLELKVNRNLIILQGMYRAILGQQFRYKIGMQGADFDLFLWNILMNRREM